MALAARFRKSRGWNRWWGRLQRLGKVKSCLTRLIHEDRLKARKRFACALRNGESAAIEPQRDIGSGGVADRSEGGLMVKFLHAALQRIALGAGVRRAHRRNR